MTGFVRPRDTLEVFCPYFILYKVWGFRQDGVLFILLLKLGGHDRRELCPEGVLSRRGLSGGVLSRGWVVGGGTVQRGYVQLPFPPHQYFVHVPGRSWVIVIFTRVLWPGMQSLKCTFVGIWGSCC